MRAPPVVESGNVPRDARGSSFLDVRLYDDAVLRAEQIFQRLQCGEGALRVLLAVAAGEADAADHFAVHYDREAADEGGKAALEAELNAERLVAGQRGAVGRLGEEMRRALVPSRSECLVPGDLRAGDARAVHALERERIAAVVDHADGLRHSQLLGLALSGLHHGARFVQLQLVRVPHRPWYTVLICV